MSRQSLWIAVSAIAVSFQISGCGSADDRPGSRRINTNADGISAPESDSEVTEGLVMKLSSTAFSQGGVVPKKHTGVGEDVSPALAWSNVPDGTKSLAIICDDPDAPSRARPRPQGPWVHWVIYNVPADVTALPEGLARKSELADHPGVRQGKNDWPDGENVGYRGPMPPPGSGQHRYFFKLYALDTTLNLDPSKATKKALLEMMEGHIIGQGELMGTFERK